MMISDINDRFELLLFETAEEYIIRKKAEADEREKKHREYKKKVEKKGVCESCGASASSGVNLKWVRDDEFYCCYECFVEDLSIEGSLMVPMHGADQMRDYLEEYEWDDLCESEKCG